MEIVAKNLTCERSGRCLLSGVSFKLGPSECLEIVGPNGAGKSTLIRALAGLGRHIRGILRVPQGKVAYLGHRNGLKPQLSVDENLDFWACVSGPLDIARAKNALGLNRLAGMMVRNLSEGQARRVALATVMYSERPIWLLDEPCASLDADGRDLATRMIVKNCRAGGISIVTAHQRMGLPGSRVLHLPKRSRTALEERTEETAIAA